MTLQEMIDRLAAIRNKDIQIFTTDLPHMVACIERGRIFSVVDEGVGEEEQLAPRTTFMPISRKEDEKKVASVNTEEPKQEAERLSEGVPSGPALSTSTTLTQEEREKRLAELKAKMQTSELPKTENRVEGQTW